MMSASKRIFVSSLVLVLSMPLLALAAGNTINDSFSRAKRMLEREVYFDHRVTIYCGAQFDEEKRISLPEGFVSPAHAKRASKVEWEHAVPAENFGRAFAEWREGDPVCIDKKGKSFKGRNCARKASERFRLMEADMYNLFPSIGSVNAVRSNKQYSELPGTPPSFGICPAKAEGNRFEPPDEAKGQLARAALYMADSYPEYRLSRQQRQLFTAWDRMYPVTVWECRRAARIERLQGNSNQRVKEPCVGAGLWEGR